MRIQHLHAGPNTCRELRRNTKRLFTLELFRHTFGLTQKPRAERQRSVWTRRRRRSPVFLARHQDGPVSITCRTTTGALPMPDRGHKRGFDSRLPTSDLPLETEIVRAGRHVSKVPRADIRLSHQLGVGLDWHDISCQGSMLSPSRLLRSAPNVEHSEVTAKMCSSLPRMSYADDNMRDIDW
jgi:hypothetical protein